MPLDKTHHENCGSRTVIQLLVKNQSGLSSTTNCCNRLAADTHASTPVHDSNSGEQNDLVVVTVTISHRSDSHSGKSNGFLGEFDGNSSSPSING
ncbi:hypothetical protein Hanom_Chr07g00642381 [Helianthus anomalus]